MIAALPMFKNAPKTKKRKVTYETHSDSESEEQHCNNITSDNEVSEYSHDYTHSIERDSKRPKTSHLTTEVILEIEDRHGNVRPIQCLLDTPGTSATIILREFVAKGKANGYKSPPTRWTTMGGVFTTKRKALLEFKLPEFSTNKTVQWVCHVDDTTTPSKAQYDIIIGTDLMSVMGLDINFSSKKICWEDVYVPMKMKGTINNAAIAQYLYNVANDVSTLQDAESCQKRILDVDYKAVDIDDYIALLPHLDDKEKAKLIKTLKKHTCLFGGGLGTLSIKPLSPYDSSHRCKTLPRTRVPCSARIRRRDEKGNRSLNANRSHKKESQ